MGTIAQFFVGHPSDTASRDWLGCVAWDGYPDGDCGALAAADSEDAFRAAVAALANEREDFTEPAQHAFPFPWTDDLYLTDCTYAWFDGAVQFTWYHGGFVPLAGYLAAPDDYKEEVDGLPGDVPAPEGKGVVPGPDSILIFSIPK